MAKTPSLRIIGGIYKGKSLQMAPLEVTRSSKAILKESLFNTLGAEIVGVNFVEFFAGSGSIGIEALSRGAQFAMFFENNSKSFGILKSNLKSILQEPSKYTLIFGDTFSLYSTYLKPLKAPCIGYIDPPFFIRKNMEDIYIKCFKMLENLNHKLFKYIILEHHSGIEIPEGIGDFTHIKTKRFGKSSLSYLAG